MSHTATPLLETEPGRTLLSVAEERGYVEPTEFDAFVVENEVNEDEAAELMSFIPFHFKTTIVKHLIEHREMENENSPSLAC